jgi:hypothetical protein
MTSKFRGIYCRLIPGLSREPLDLFSLSYSVRTQVRCMKNAVVRPGSWFICVLGWLQFSLLAYFLTAVSQHDLIALSLCVPGPPPMPSCGPTNKSSFSGR